MDVVAATVESTRVQAPIDESWSACSTEPMLASSLILAARAALFMYALSVPADPSAVRPPVEAVLLHPLFDHPFLCRDHPESDGSGLGDAFGDDCMVMGMDKAGFPRLFRTDGRTNADWYGWGAAVLAPFDGVVRQVRVNPVVNRPGVPGSSPASQIVFGRSDGLIVAYAHVADLRVKVGDSVKAGQVVAVDGNNGAAEAPHVHVGAFRGRVPFQIRWDQRAEGRLPAFQ